MPRVTRPRPTPALPQPRDVSRRPSGLKLLLRRQRRYLRPAIWGMGGFALVMCALLLVHSAQPGGTVARLRDGMASAANMRVQKIVIEGRSNTPEVLLNAALGVHLGDSMLGFSINGARERIETLSWVESAAVERRLPGTLVVNLVERRPFAIWQNQGKFVLIDRDGQVVANEDVAAFGELPLVVGAGAPQAATTLLEALAAQPALKSRVVAAVRVGERRWNLRMKNGTDVLLPEGAAPQALAKLAELQSSESLLDRPLAVVDMRLPDRLVVRPQPSASAPNQGPATGKKA
ncbi:cell division protein FtsQ/DivIB [Acidisphaera sp. L21]|uniref:cell division protein FtsQ/DivIB n=1 Tax=Acidisphaera sp. L21 TaxID=1641851 RepID=UPI00131CA157|nr:cell division protein FtsQ/DivIB [Acidisphaera sp. L21]